MQNIAISVRQFAKNLFRLEKLQEKETENTRLKDQLKDCQSRSYDILISSAAYVMKLNRQHLEEVDALKSEVNVLREENQRLHGLLGSRFWEEPQKEVI